MKQKNQKQILAKLGITELNAMQEEAQLAIHSSTEVVLLSPTGTGKTLAFLLPLMAELDAEATESTQAMIVAPSRELAIQIEQVAREMGTGHKVNVVYGGRHFSKDRQELATAPTLIIGTPGRLADHLRRGTVSGTSVATLVLDEFDKSLEVGFEDEMKEIVAALPSLKKKVLTSATSGVEVPKFMDLAAPVMIDHLTDGVAKLQLRNIISPSKDKLQTLMEALCHLGGGPGIVFCNYKDSIRRVSDYLLEHGIAHGTFYGGMEQKERERALIKFRNGSHQLLVATDLAARGLDIPEIKFIIHYHLPHREEEFVHRNGRTARMHKEGTAYVLHWDGEDLPDFIHTDRQEFLAPAPIPKPPHWVTLFISGGRQDKISKGDIAGSLIKVCKLAPEAVGTIELKQDCAFVAVSKAAAKQAVEKLNNQKIKKRKVRVYEV